jgi:hypothetical protein
LACVARSVFSGASKHSSFRFCGWRTGSQEAQDRQAVEEAESALITAVGTSSGSPLKKVRYACEFFESVYEGRKIERRRKVLATWLKQQIKRTVSRAL